MRTLLCSCAAVGAGGWVVAGNGAAPDFDRTLPKSATSVYAAFSELAAAGEVTSPPKPGVPSVTIRVRKAEGREIDYEVLVDGGAAVTVSLDFEPVENGAATRVTGELDINQVRIAQLARIAEGAGGDGSVPIAVASMPASLYDYAFGQWMESMTDIIAEGGRLPSLESSQQSAMRDLSATGGVAAERSRREASSAGPPRR